MSDTIRFRTVCLYNESPRKSRLIGGIMGNPTFLYPSKKKNAKTNIRQEYGEIKPDHNVHNSILDSRMKILCPENTII